MTRKYPVKIAQRIRCSETTMGESTTFGKEKFMVHHKRKGIALRDITIRTGWENDDFSKGLISIIFQAFQVHIPRILNYSNKRLNNKSWNKHLKRK